MKEQILKNLDNMSQSLTNIRRSLRATYQAVNGSSFNEPPKLDGDAGVVFEGFLTCACDLWNGRKERSKRLWEAYRVFERHLGVDPVFDSWKAFGQQMGRRFVRVKSNGRTYYQNLVLRKPKDWELLSLDQIRARIYMPDYTPPPRMSELRQISKED